MIDQAVDCRQFDDASWLLLSDELNDAARVEWHRHLAGCRQCAHLLAERRHVLDVYDGVVTTGDHTRGLSRFTPPVRGFSWRAMLGRAAATVLLVAVGAVAGIELTRISTPPASRNEALRLDDLEVQLAQARIIQATAAERLKAAAAVVPLASRDPRMLDSLLDALEADASPNVRMAIIDALYTVEPSSSLQPRFGQLVAAQSLPMLRIALIELAADRRLAGTVPDLERIAGEPGDESVRQRARWALTVLRGTI